MRERGTVLMTAAAVWPRSTSAKRPRAERHCYSSSSVATPWGQVCLLGGDAAGDHGHAGDMGERGPRVSMREAAGVRVSCQV